MSSNYITVIFKLVLLMLIQVLVCNNIHLFSYATPLLIGYMILSTERGTDRCGLLLWGFCIGLFYDMFSNTSGMATAACTLLAMLQPNILNAFMTSDAAESMEPNIKNMGFSKFTTYTFFSMFVLHSVFFALDAFMLANIQLTLLATISSTILATILTLFVEMLTSTTKR